MKPDYWIDTMQDHDWEQVRAIYQEGIATGNATFEVEVPSWERWTSSRLATGRLVARVADEPTHSDPMQGEQRQRERDRSMVAGWATLLPTSDRCIYAGVAEVSVYVGTAHCGQGIGRALLEALIQVSEEQGIWTLQAGIFPENLASLALHRRCSFREIGRRERIGQMNGCWRDVILLERRSSVVGV
jgi:phosphinothricin acetyltransferase